MVELFGYIKHNLFRILFFSIIVGAIALAIALLLPNNYICTVEFYTKIDSQNKAFLIDNSDGPNANGMLSADQLISNDVVEILKGDKLFNDVCDEFGYSRNMSNVNSTITSSSKNKVIQYSLSSIHRDQLEKVTDYIGKRTVEIMNDLTGVDAVRLIDDSYPQARLKGPNRLLIVAVAICAALVVSVLYYLCKDGLRPTVKSKSFFRKLKSGNKCIVMPHVNKRYLDYSKTTSHSHNQISSHFRKLSLAINTGSALIGVLSSFNNDDRSKVAFGLATQIASPENKVLIVCNNKDQKYYKKILDGSFGDISNNINPGHNFYCGTKVPNLYFTSYNLLSSYFKNANVNSSKDVYQELKSLFNRVVFDIPEIEKYSTSLHVVKNIDSLVFVARQYYTQTNHALSSLSLLESFNEIDTYVLSGVKKRDLAQALSME